MIASDRAHVGRSIFCLQCKKLFVSHRGFFCSRSCYRAFRQVSRTERLRADRGFDLTGRTFGEYYVIRKDDPDKFGVTAWLCRCSCGTIRRVTGYQLRSGDSQRCNTCRLQNTGRIGGSVLKVIRTKRPFESRYGLLLRGAAPRNIEVTITYEQYLEFTKVAECFYCSAPIEWTGVNRLGVKGSSSYFLDRIDNTIGYTVDNVVVACARCNWARADNFTFEEWYGMTAYFREK